MRELLARDIIRRQVQMLETTRMMHQLLRQVLVAVGVDHQQPQRQSQEPDHQHQRQLRQPQPQRQLRQPQPQRQS